MASALARLVLPTPGTSSINTCPPATMARTTISATGPVPRTTRETFSTTAVHVSRASAGVATALALASMGDAWANGVLLGRVVRVGGPRARTPPAPGRIGCRAMPGDEVLAL